MTNAWDHVRAAIDAEDAAAVATLVAGFDDAQRREVARELPGYLPIAREAGERRDGERELERQARWAALQDRAQRMGRSVYDMPEMYSHVTQEIGSRWIEPMRVAGAGAISGAAGVAAWLNKRDLERGWEPPEADDVPLIVRVVAARPAAWQEDLAVRLALRLRSSRPPADKRVRLTLELLRGIGVTPPEHDPLTLAWIATTPAADLAADPLLDVMAPRLFEAEGAGRLLRDDRHWAAALGELADAGRIGRESLLAGCRTRFLRGGQAADQRFFLRLHELLDPTGEEVAPHLRDYLALLPSAPANVADLALKQVRRLGPVPPEQAGEAVEGLLFRSEGKLVRAGLAWLDRLLKDPAGDLDAYAPALATALVCESADARERAVKLAVKHAGRFSPLGAETIRDAVAMLPARQGAELAAAFGGEAAAEPEPTRFLPSPLPPVPEPPRMPPPVRDPEKLVRLHLSEYDWLSSEIWLDGFVRLAAGRGQERDRLITALAPLAARHTGDRRLEWSWSSADWAAAMARELTHPDADRSAAGTWVPAMTHGPLWKLMPLFRYAEAYQALVAGRLPPCLLSTPTHANGLLDPEALVERLEGYERAGVAALPLDLRQALLRLRRTVTGEVAARAARLTGEAGRQVARWLAERPAEPQVVLRWTAHEGDTRIDSEFVPGPEYEQVLGDLLTPRFQDESSEQLLAVLAGHRELAAARCVYALKSYWPLTSPSYKDLDLFAAAEGPGGPGLALLLAYYLLIGPDGGAVGPLLRLAATGDLPGEELGRQLAVLLRRDEGGPSGALAALREAAENGAHREVWQVMAGLLTAYLPGPGERATTAHTRLMTFAAEVAEWADARGELAVVAELAGRGRGSELVRQARRLHGRLTGPSSTPAGVPA
ncbi:DUF7824 domain-containing protein [Nonomuraea sp. LPB2021202275-12-8]|uniref:DUF7824 domain-containing protein n=1 Tax=Nonomuraea sp. LPB2021202275-12-8 TaxID=3120159 RepID=UPI00300D4D2B